MLNCSVLLVALILMERKSEKLADLAAMFADVDLEIIENLLEMCDGKVNRTAEMLLKMKEDNERIEKESEVKVSNNVALKDDFLELDDDDEPEKPLEEKYRNPEEVVIEDEIYEQEYFAEVQKAIEMSLEPKKKPSNARKNVESKAKIEKKKPDPVKEVKNVKVGKDKPKDPELIVPIDPDEEVIQFIFRENNFIRGENLNFNS